MTYVDYMKNAILETITNTTDENIIRYVYTTLMNSTPEEMLPKDS